MMGAAKAKWNCTGAEKMLLLVSFRGISLK